jgi:hypothetical protein
MAIPGLWEEFPSLCTGEILGIADLSVLAGPDSEGQLLILARTAS